MVSRMVAAAHGGNDGVHSGGNSYVGIYESGDYCSSVGGGDVVVLAVAR